MYYTDQIAILLASYNGERYIREQLNSLFQQTNQNWHLYIHDDGSKDQTLSIIEEYQVRYPERITILEGPATGSSRDNFFYLLSQVNAPYYFFCDQDDVWLPQKIQKTYERMIEIEDKDLPCLVFTDLKVVDESLNTIAEKMEDYQKLNYKDLSFKQLMVQAAVTGCTVVINQKLRMEMLRNNDHENIIMHDWWASMIAAKFGKITCLNEPLILYRQHSENNVGAKNYTFFEISKKVITNRIQIRNSIVMTMKQAQKFADTFSSSPNETECYFASLISLRKDQRMVICFKNKIHKTPLSRDIGFYLLGL